MAETTQQQWATRADLRRASPYGRALYVNVTFTDANIDTAIRHTLKVANSNDVRYEAVRKDRTCDVYEDYSPHRKPWQPDLIYLKCTVAGAQVRLKLFTERQSDV